MPMEIKLITHCINSSHHKLTYLIVCCAENEGDNYSTYVDIQDVVKVRFNFRLQSSLQIHVEGQIIEKDSNVIVRVSCEQPKYFLERIYQDDLKWSNFIGEMGYWTRSWGVKDWTYIYQFSISLSAYKIKNIVQKKLYNDTEFTDFCLSTAEGTGSVAVHKALLAAHSDVFRAMLSREWKETNEGRIRMEGITLHTLQHLKDYMYLGTLPDDDLLPLWSIASCYLIDDLKARCLFKLTDVIKPENFYSMLEYSIENKMAELTFALIKDTPENVVWDAEKIINEKKVTEETEKE